MEEVLVGVDAAPEKTRRAGMVRNVVLHEMIWLSYVEHKPSRIYSRRKKNIMRWS